MDRLLGALTQLRAYRAVAVAIAVGLLASFSLFYFTWQYHTKATRAEAAVRIEQRIRAFEAALRHYEDIVSSVAAFVGGAKGEADEEEFIAAAAHLAGSYAGIQAISYVPRVAGPARVEFEAAARARWHPGYAIFERTSTGAKVAAGSREEYFPILHVAPRSGNEVLLGFDIGLERRRILERARDLGQLASSGLIRLMDDRAGDRDGLLLVGPVYRSAVGMSTATERRQRLLGFVVVALRIDEMIEFIYATQTVPRGFDQYFFRGPAADIANLVHVHGSRLRGPGDPVPAFDPVHSTVESIDRLSIGDQTLTIVTRARPQAYSLAPDEDAWGILLIGLLVSTLVSRDLFWAVRRAESEALAREGLSKQVGERKAAQKALLRSIVQMQAQLKAVGEIGQAKELLSGDVAELARKVTETAARVIGCERVNVWLFERSETSLRCIDLYEATPARHSEGMRLEERQFRNEFEALKASKYVDADDALSDPRTAGYVDAYLKPLRITSMLDTVIRIAGQNMGLLCFEHVDRPHLWQPDEISFASHLADKLGLSILSAQRRETEDELRASETRFRTVFESVYDGIIVHDLESGTFIDANRRTLEMFGYAREDFLRLGLGDLSSGIPPYTPADAASYRDRLVSGEAPVFEWQAKARDGHVFWVEVSLKKASFGDRDVMISATRDIDDRKTAERKLTFANTLLTTEAESSPDGILVVDHAGKIVSFNRRFVEMWKVPAGLAEAGDDTKILEAMVGQMADPPGFLERVRYLYAHPEVVSEDEIVTADGRFIDRRSRSMTTAAGQNLGRIWFFRDITERNRTEAALRESQQIIEGILNSIPMRVFWKDRDLVYLGCNATFAVDAGFAEPKDIVGKDDFQMGWRAQAELYRSDDRRVIETGQAKLFIEEPQTTPDGRTITLLTSKVPLRDADEKVVGVLGTYMDISERKRAEEELRLSEAKYHDLFASTFDAITMMDPSSGVFLAANPSALKLFGARDEADFTSRTPWELSPERQPDGRLSAEKAREMIEAAVRVGTHSFEWQHKRVDGKEFPADILLTRVMRGEKPMIYGTVRDLTERKRIEEQIRKLARHDLLTGLPNRAVFVEALQQSIARAKRSARIFAVLYLDLDHFKDVNDTLGHPVGDLLLQAVAKRLQGVIRETDAVARFGGDEFAIIATDLREPADAAVLADKVLGAIATSFPIEGNEIRTGTSVGIAVYGTDSPDAETLLSHADVALYRAKAEGRGTYRYFTDAMDTEVRTRVTLGAELRDGIANGQLFLVYQPQVATGTGRIVGVEALVRWRHPKRGLVSPAEFVPIAEKSGLIVALGHWVLHEACRQMREWIDAGIAPPVIGVNVSSLQFKTPLELENDIASALKEAALAPGCLELELTESVLMEASQEHSDVLMRLRQLGLRLSIDDFGTGYSSLDYLRRFPFDRVKIAQDFVRDLTETSSNATIVKTAIGLALGLGLGVIVEGVETAEQLALIGSWGCGEVQGYYYSKPLPSAEVAVLLRAGEIRPPPANVAAV